MKVKKITVDDLKNIYTHPAIILFRSIELKTIYDNVKTIELRHPSVDIGCGDGKIAEILFDEKITYGVDNGEAQDYQEAIQYKRYRKVLLESAENISIPDKSVNLVFSNSVLEHIPAIDKVLSEVSRILKTGGDFIFTVPSDNFPHYLYLKNKLPDILGKHYSYYRTHKLNHYHMYSHREWKEKLAAHHLHIKSFQYYISKGTLMFWDKIALKVYLKRIFDKTIEKKLLNAYQKNIYYFFNHDSVKDANGAALFIHCVKK